MDSKQHHQSSPDSLRKKCFTLLDTSPNCGLYSRLLDLFLITLILVNVAAVIMETVVSFEQQYRIELHWLELISVMIFTVEYFARWWVAPESHDYEGMSSTKARLKHLSTSMAIVDLIAIAPYFLSSIFNLDLRFLRILRLFRLFKLTRYSEAMTTMLTVLHDEARNFIAAIFIMLVVMVIAASGIYMVEHDHQPEVFGSIPQAMWWSTVTLTTVGYGDVYPITFFGKIFAAIIMVAGVGLVALPTGILASSFSDNLRRSREKMKKGLSEVIEDGEIHEDDEDQLERLRKEIGLTSEQFQEMKETALKNQASIEQDQHPVCPHCGR